MPVIRKQIYAMTLGSQVQTTLIDATTYYFGKISNGMVTATAYQDQLIPRTGIIVACTISTYSDTAGSAEAWAMYLRNDTKATETLIESKTLNTNHREWKNYNLNIPVSAGDNIFFKTTTPTWVTNPDMTWAYATVLISY